MVESKLYNVSLQMRSKEAFYKERENELEKDVVASYLKYGSVEELQEATLYSLPFSFASIHRILDKYGVVKAAGPNKPITEAIGFFVKMIERKVPLETLYRSMPPRFAASMTTLHRMYRQVKEEVKKEIGERDMRRRGTAVLLHPVQEQYLALVGRDVSPAKIDVGRPFGAHSFPMGFSKLGEPAQDSILRVLQKEAFTPQVLQRNFPEEVIEKSEAASPFMYLDIADVRVAVYSIALSPKLSDLSNFESFKLKNYEYIDLRELAKVKSLDRTYRLGMVEIAKGYINYVSFPKSVPSYVTSDLNLALARD